METWDRVSLVRGVVADETVFRTDLKIICIEVALQTSMVGIPDLGGGSAAPTLFPYPLDDFIKAG